MDILRDIYTWANDENGRTIFFLNGLAGTGKSTVARTVARYYFDKQRLGASFFFSRGGGDVGHAAKFATTIAVQLATSIPTLNHYVSDAVLERSDIASRSLRDQWQELVLSPLSKLDGCQSWYTLVVDALDECGNEDDIRLILHLLADVRSLKRVRLRVLLTSRPEIPIRHGFRQIPDGEHQDFVLHNMSRSIVDHDINIFFEHNLRAIQQERSLATGWPGEEIVEKLVQTACGLFIWAATACRYIHNGKRHAAKRLDTILKGSSSSSTESEKHLDDIYTTVLGHSISSEYTAEEKEESYGMLRLILGSIVLLSSPLSIHSLHKLLHLPKEDVVQTLEDLHSVIDIPQDNKDPLRLHHPSFRDFLLSKDRCQKADLWVNEKQAHQMLADSCLQLLSTSLKQDICELNAPGMFAAKVESSRVYQYLPPEVQYACLYWVHHLHRSGTLLRDDDKVHRFLQEHLIHWLEALGWMGEVPEGAHAVTVLEAIVVVCSFNHRSHVLLRYVLGAQVSPTARICPRCEAIRLLQPANY
jgi:hypothetical protein